MDIGTIYYLALFVALYMAWNIGANDVANSMGTSVGSKAITLKQAVIIAAVFEFGGAFLVGGSVTKTVRKGILDTDIFMNGTAEIQQMFVIAMFAALLASAVWLNVATYFGWPVSTTHSIVGGIVGGGLVIAGSSAVQWGQIGFVVASWVVSPAVGAIVAASVYLLIKRLLIDKEDKVYAVKRWAPVLLGPIFLVLFMILFVKGLKNIKVIKEMGILLQLAISVVAGGVLSAFAAMPIRKFIDQKMAKNNGFDPIEGLFIYLQVVTACFVAFAHGSNDVANAIGPIAAIRDFYIHGGLSTGGSEVTPWLLAMGGVGIVIGLATYGYKVIATIGEKVTELVPTRGFAAEFGASITILVGSYLGLPLSTTHTLVGAVIGVGLARGREHVDFGTLRLIVASWVATLPFAAAIAAAVTWIMIQF